MQTRSDKRLAGLDAASHPFAQTALGFQRDQRGIGLCFVALLQRRLDGSKLFCLHGTLSTSVRFARVLATHAFDDAGPLRPRVSSI